MADLSVREAEALRLAARGLRGKEIAHALGVSVSTAAADLGRALTRLGLRRSQLGLVAGSWDERQLDLPRLTPAEREILRAVLAGRSNAEIAAERQRSPHTVANQVASVFRKLGINSRAELYAGAWVRRVEGA